MQIFNSFMCSYHMVIVELCYGDVNEARSMYMKRKILILFQIYGFILYVSTDLCGWIVVLVGIERMIAVTVPHKVKIWFSMSRVSCVQHSSSFHDVNKVWCVWIPQNVFIFRNGTSIRHPKTHMFVKFCEFFKDSPSQLLIQDLLIQDLLFSKQRHLIVNPTIPRPKRNIQEQYSTMG